MSCIEQKKTVKFAEDTIDPPITERCACCTHRNIIPKIREMDLCLECFRQICSECLSTIGICDDCMDDLFESAVCSQEGDYSDLSE